MSDAGKPKPASLADTTSLADGKDAADSTGPDGPVPAAAGDVKSRNKDELWVTGIWLRQTMPFWANENDRLFVVGEHDDSIRQKCSATGHLSVASSPGEEPSVVIESLTPDNPGIREIIRNGVLEATGWPTSFAVSTTF